MGLLGYVVNFRIGPKSQNPRECILYFPGYDDASRAAQLIGRKVAWPVGERTHRGKIVAVHGRRGHVRARFRKGLPGYALGTQVEIIG
ncbi:50S ribosomal protein L35ae [Candidatus Bathyarchaeota archaeon]|nr:MAG: 50S ribosomal protein L35ae [Candidatus Bathyarchaeota archaeon]